MDTDKIIQDLNRRFAAPLPEFYQRRIIFWYDEDKEFEDKLDEVVLENAKVIALTGNNAFSVKKLLSVDDLTTNYLVYSPCVYNRPATRKERTHRLCTRGGMLESYLPHPEAIMDEQVSLFLKLLFHKDSTRQLMEKVFAENSTAKEGAE